LVGLLWLAIIQPSIAHKEIFDWLELTGPPPNLVGGSFSFWLKMLK